MEDYSVGHCYKIQNGGDNGETGRPLMIFSFHRIVAPSIESIGRCFLSFYFLQEVSLDIPMADKTIASAFTPQTTTPYSRSPQFWLKIFVVLQLTLLAIEFSPDFSTNGDDAKYYLLGKSVFSGNGYRDIFDPQNPVHTQYPPLFPVLLGMTEVITHSPLVPKIMVGFFSAGILLLLFYYLRPFAGAVFLPLLLITALSSSLASHATLLMSEIPYLFASLAALLLLALQKKGRTLNLLFWMVAFAATAPALIRTAGISFAAAWTLTAIIDKRYKQAAAYLALFAVIMLLLRLMADVQNPYVDVLFRKNQYDPELGFVSVGEMFSRIRQNLDLYLFSIIPQTLLKPDLDKSSSMVAALLLLVPALIGWIRNVKTPTAIISYYLLFYAGIISLWQTQWSSTRLILPLIPFLLFFMLSGLEFMTQQVFRPFAKTIKPGTLRRLTTGVIWTAALVVCVFNLSDHLRLMKSTDGMTNDWKNFYSCADWLRLNTQSDAIVVTRKPELFYLRSQRKGFVYPFSHDVEKIIGSFKEGNVRYCVLDNFFWTNTSVRYLFPAIMSHPEMFRVVYSLKNPETYVLEFRAK
jgi:hypothetical protein